MKVVVMGPNLRADEDFHVHVAGCADLKKALYRGIGRDTNDWVYDAVSQQEVIEDIFSETDLADGGDWRDMTTSIRFFPCTNGLPEETP
jgi:hypothetical protein